MADKVKVVNATKLDMSLSNIGNAIRRKIGSSKLFTSSDAMVQAIDSISTGEQFTPTLVSIVDRTIRELKTDKITTIGISAFQNCNNLTTVSLPIAVNIEKKAFDDCGSLATASFPSAVNIGAYAFSGCRQLTTAFFPSAVNIGVLAFGFCSRLKDIDFPMVVNIEGQAFLYAADLKTAVFPALTKLSANAFELSGLQQLTLSGPKVCEALGDPQLKSTCQIFVPANLIEQYKVAPNWSKYASQFVAIQ